MKHWKKYIFLSAILFVFLYVILKPTPPLEVSFASVQRKSIAEYVEEEGKTQLKEDVKIFPSLAGFLGHVQVDVGDFVKKGQILAQIDPFTQNQEIQSLQAEIQAIRHQMEGIEQTKPKKSEYLRANLLIEQSKVQVELAKKDILTLELKLEQTQREYRRIQGLSEQGISTTQDKDSITTQYRIEQENLAKVKSQLSIAEQNLNIAIENQNLLKDAEDDQEYMRSVYQQQIVGIEAKIKVLENDLKKTELTSPFDGIVLERITRGNVYLSFVTPDYYILRIGDLNTLEIKVDLLSDEIHKIKEGQKALIFGPSLGSGKKILGTVVKIHPTAFTKLSSLGIEQQRVTIILSVPKEGIVLYPGYRVDVRIFTREKEIAFVVPSRAVFSLLGQKHCFIVQNNQAQLQRVHVGIENEEETEIVEGLQENQIVIIDPPNELTNNRLVSKK